MNLLQIVKVISCIVVAFVMTEITFFEKTLRNAITMCVIFIFVSATIGGIMSLLYTFFNDVISEFISTYSYEATYSRARMFIIILLTGVVTMIYARMFKDKKAVKCVNAKIIVGKNEYVLDCLCDSGNLLKEPFSGKAVILVSCESKIGQDIEKIEDIYKRYIPYRDVNAEGVLKGVIPKKIEINKVLVDAVVATVCNKDFSGYDALIPTSLI